MREGCILWSHSPAMNEREPVLMEIERLLTQVVVVALALIGASFTRRGLYYRDEDAVAAGAATALIWVLAMAFARWRQGPDAWWLLITAPVVLAMPVTKLGAWLLY